MSIFDLTASEKLQLVEDLWDDLAASAEEVPIHDWQKEELARRKANLANNPASGLSWEEVKRRKMRRRDPISNDQELQTTQERIVYFQAILAQLRVTASREQFPLMASGYRAEIEQMQREVLDYLTRHASECVTAEAG